MKLALGAITVGVVLGVVGVGTFQGVMHYTSTDAFCGESCHEMSMPTAALQETGHYRNVHGVSVGCSDCAGAAKALTSKRNKLKARRRKGHTLLARRV